MHAICGVFVLIAYESLEYHGEGKSGSTAGRSSSEVVRRFPGPTRVPVPNSLSASHVDRGARSTILKEIVDFAPSLQLSLPYLTAAVPGCGREACIYRTAHPEPGAVTLSVALVGRPSNHCRLLVDPGRASVTS